MKSVFNKIEKEKSKEIVFPVLAEYVYGDSFVVMFLSSKSGVCVSSNNLDWSVGYYSKALVEVASDCWRILYSEESIVLSND